MNPVTNTPDAVLAETAEPVDALDALLRQIVNGYFVLTDGQGAVSKWSEPAELLFAQPSEDILGQGFFESLIGETLPAEGHAWRGFLATGEPPQAPGTVRLTGNRSDGEVFPLEAVFVPVKLDEGFDFSLFLEDLSFELPMNLMLLRMRQQHPVVVRALKQALEPHAQPWEGWRTAGTLVVFRPLSSTPWVESELARRMAERAAADAEAEERLTNFDPGIQGSVNDLDDAAAVVARLLSALERIDELERVAGGLPAQLEETRREAGQQSAALRSDVQRALSAVPSELDRHEEQAKLAKAEAAAERLNARIDQLERDRAQAATLADARIGEAVAAAEARAVEAIAESARRADAARAALESRLDGVDVSSQLQQVRAEHEEAAQAARVELATTIERLEREREREREAARAELASALERIDQVQRGADAVREQLSNVTVERAAVTGDDRRRLDELQRESEALRDRVEAMGALENEVASLRRTVADNDLREALDAHFMATASQVAELRDIVTRHEASNAEVDALREAVARHEAAAGEVGKLREAVERHEAATGEAVERHEAVAAEVAALRDAIVAAPSADPAVAADVATLREAVAALQGNPAELAALREAVAGLQATPLADPADVAALREAVAALQASPTADPAVAGEVATLREALARQEAATADLAGLREAVARHEAASAELAGLRAALSSVAPAAEVAELRRALSEQQATAAGVEHQLAELRSHLSQAETAAVRAGDQADVERQVQTMVGDTQRQIAALHARLAVLADTGREVAELKTRLDDVAEIRASLDHLARDEDVAALRDRVDNLPGRDELAALAGRNDVEALRERIADVASRADVDAIREHLAGLAGRDELAGLATRDDIAGLPTRDELDGLATRDEIAALPTRDEILTRDDLAPLRERLEGVAARDELNVLREQLAGLAARHEVVAIHERIEELVAARDELRARINPEDGGVAAQALAAAEHALEQIAQVDRGAGTVLADVRGLREAVDRVNGALDVARSQADRAEAEALGAHEAAAAAGEAAGAAREDAAKAREESAAVRLEVEGQRERTTLLGEQITGTREAANTARTDAAAARSATEGLDERLAALRTELGAGRERVDAVGARVEQIGEGASELRTELGEIREVAENTARAVEALRADLTSARAAEQKVDAMQAELNFTLKSLEELKQGLSSAGQAAVIARREAEQARKAAQHVGDGSTERVTEVFQQILGLAANRNAQNRRATTPTPAPPKEQPVREPRHGFDDVTKPMAILTLDGKFKELNPSFTKLVGYKEHEFTKAAWPSPHDRRDYKDQLEHLRLMGAGELPEIAVQSTYMHGQGLMVPVVGKLSVENGEDGLPLHLVLEAEDRHTN